MYIVRLGPPCPDCQRVIQTMVSKFFSIDQFSPFLVNKLVSPYEKNSVVQFINVFNMNDKNILINNMGKYANCFVDGIL